MPQTTSLRPAPAFLIADFASPLRSSAPSCDRKTAFLPPATMARIFDGSVPNVGGHSAASRTPSRPLVPAPT
ncbi:hypothetical protein D3C83_197170 [compost metagenome]